MTAQKYGDDAPLLSAPSQQNSPNRTQPPRKGEAGWSRAQSSSCRSSPPSCCWEMLLPALAFAIELLFVESKQGSTATDLSQAVQTLHAQVSLEDLPLLGSRCARRRCSTRDGHL